MTALFSLKFSEGNKKIGNSVGKYRWSLYRGQQILYSSHIMSTGYPGLITRFRIFPTTILTQNQYLPIPIFVSRS